MSKLHDFLVEHAKFPFPPLHEHLAAYTTDISTIDVELLEKEWRAKLAVRDDNFIQNLCGALEHILGDARLADSDESDLLASFAPKIQFPERGGEDEDWSSNPNETWSRRLLDKSFFVAARKCFWVYDQSTFGMTAEHLAEHGNSEVDYTVQVDKKLMGLCEAISPSVMKNVYDSLPSRGIELEWVQGQPLVSKILSKAALYLGLRKTAWLFLTCYNYWIVCRLVKDDVKPYLAYSQGISIDDSSEPFRAFLGAILSVVKGVAVEPSAYNPNIQLDTIEENQDKGPLPEDDIDDRSGEYQDSSGRGADASFPITRSRARNHRRGNTESELLVTASSPKSPENFQVWTRLYTMPNNVFTIPPWAREDKLRLWFTRFIASGSTGSVWQCRFNTSNDSFAAKIVEMLRPSDTEKRQRLRNEFKTYLILEEAYQSGRLHDPIAPRCYGAFEGSRMDVLILDLCDGILNSWDDLSASGRSDVYKLVQDLHSIGLVHKDLEPRNIVRTHGGGYLLIDFSESRTHICKESKVHVPHRAHTHLVPDQDQKCSELQTLRKLLWQKQPLQAKRINFG
ncbi:hypothetical protein BC826DRAFT_1012766 [Russula brevipes]|nr:hypothetical protein BC826DRAFT_1012766 [Russula brevipes]